MKCSLFILTPILLKTAMCPRHKNTAALTPMYQNRSPTARTRKPIHLSALSISHWITGSVCQMHLNPDHSHSAQPSSFNCSAQAETNWIERKGGKKNSRHPFIVCTGKSADYCNRTKHLLGFILLIYSWQLSDWWRGVRLKVAGGVAFLSPRFVLLVLLSL